MRATAEPVEGNRMRLSVEVDEKEVSRAVDDTVRRLVRQVRIPGFRQGKVPRAVLEARYGGALALRQEAIRDALPDLYARAVIDAAVDPIAPPEIDIRSGEDTGPLLFDALVEVRPTVAIPGYAGLAVTVPSVDVDEAEVDRQIDRLREQGGELVEVDRPAVDGDWLTVDVHGVQPGAEDLHVEDYLYELGDGTAIPGLDDRLRGVRPGDVVEFDAPVSGAEPGKSATSDSEEGDTATGGPPATSFRVEVKEVKEKTLPDVTDTWAAEASEFATVAELREDIRGRLQKVKALQAQMTLRERALEALVALVEEEPPAALVNSEIDERLHELSHQLEQRRLTIDQYLGATGRDADGLSAELREDALRSVRADLALRALADAEEIEVTDADLDEVIAELATRQGMSPAEVLRRLDRAGSLPAVRSDQRKAKALQWLLDHVALVDEDGKSVTREQLGLAGTTPGEDGELSDPGGGQAQGVQDVENEENES
jgi:trigger factor